MNDGERRRFQKVLDGLQANALATTSRCDVLPEGGQELATALRGNRSGQRVVLRGCGFGSTGAVALAAALSGSQVSDLLIDENNIGPEGAAALASLLQSAPLARLEMSDNLLGDEGAKALAATLAGSSLANLQLAFCRIGAAGVKALALGMRGSCLLELNLTDNNLGDQGALALAAAVAEAPLTKLNLVNTGIQQEGAKALAAALRDSFLEELALGGNSIGEEGAQALLLGAKDSNIIRPWLFGWSREMAEAINVVLGENKARAFLLQMQVEGAEPDWALTFRTLAGAVAAVLTWSPERRVQEVPQAVLAEMRASGFPLPVKQLTARHLRIVRPDGQVLDTAETADALTAQLAGRREEIVD